MWSAGSVATPRQLRALWCYASLRTLLLLLLSEMCVLVELTLDVLLPAALLLSPAALLLAEGVLVRWRDRWKRECRRRLTTATDWERIEVRSRGVR